MDVLIAKHTTLLVHGQKQQRGVWYGMVGFNAPLDTLYRVAQKNGASVFHCKYFENSTTELRGNTASTCLLIYSSSSRLMTSQLTS